LDRIDDPINDPVDFIISKKDTPTWLFGMGEGGDLESLSFSIMGIVRMGILS
jgi:hypothetical protein